MENWVKIKNFEDYEISDYGRVKSNKTNKILKPWVHNKYVYVSLCKNGKDTHKIVHRLVGDAFIPNPNNYPQINHKDENPQNNYVGNLEWCTAKYNANYGKRNSYVARPVICLETRKIYNSGTECARDIGVDTSAISTCCNLKNRKTIKGLHFCYLDNIMTIEEIDNFKMQPRKNKLARLVVASRL